jgi:hypothetical protein
VTKNFGLLIIIVCLIEYLVDENNLVFRQKDLVRGHSLKIWQGSEIAGALHRGQSNAGHSNIGDPSSIYPPAVGMHVARADFAQRM